MSKVKRLTENDLVRLVKKVINEQSAVKPAGGGQSGRYCKVGQSQGVLKQHATGTSGPNVAMGETGFGLFDPSGKMICMISTKYTQGGYVATAGQPKPA